MKRAALYVRVSTPDQHVESQLYDLRELAAQRGFEIVQEYEDRGVFVERRHAVRGLICSWLMRVGKSSPLFSWQRSTALRGALGISYK